MGDSGIELKARIDMNDPMVKTLRRIAGIIVIDDITEGAGFIPAI